MGKRSVLSIIGEHLRKHIDCYPKVKHFMEFNKDEHVYIPNKRVYAAMIKKHHDEIIRKALLIEEPTEKMEVLTSTRTE